MCCGFLVPAPQHRHSLPLLQLWEASAAAVPKVSHHQPPQAFERLLFTRLLQGAQLIGMLGSCKLDVAARECLASSSPSRMLHHAAAERLGGTQEGAQTRARHLDVLP